MFGLFADSSAGCILAQLHACFFFRAIFFVCFFLFHQSFCRSADLLVGLWLPKVSSAQQHKVDWRVRGQHLSVDKQKINLGKVR